MADPRKDVDFEGIDALPVTFKIDSSIIYDALQVGGAAQVGLAVTMKSAKTVGLVADGERVHGKLLKVEADGYCGVLMEGGCDLPAGTAAALGIGKKIVGALLGAAKGYIRAADVTVLAEAHAASGEILDATTTTAVKVMLG